MMADCLLYLCPTDASDSKPTMNELDPDDIVGALTFEREWLQESFIQNETLRSAGQTCCCAQQEYSLARGSFSGFICIAYAAAIIAAFAVTPRL